jgi:hypothetical protein
METSSAVVPAKAGTILCGGWGRAQWVTSEPCTSAGGYVSRRSPGRRLNEWLAGMHIAIARVGDMHPRMDLRKREDSERVSALSGKSRRVRADMIVTIASSVRKRVAPKNSFCVAIQSVSPFAAVAHENFTFFFSEIMIV